MLLALVCLACSDRTTTSEGGGEESGMSEPSTDSTQTQTGELPSCEAAFPDCSSVPDCETVSAIPQSYNMNEGCYFSDLALPIGCAQAPCESVQDVVLCNDEDPDELVRIFSACLPLTGWTPCDETCPFE